MSENFLYYVLFCQITPPISKKHYIEGQTTLFDMHIIIAYKIVYKWKITVKENVQGCRLNVINYSRYFIES